MGEELQREIRADGGKTLLFAGAVAAAFLILLYGSLFKGIPMGRGGADFYWRAIRLDADCL